jgi:adenine-specific DNA-methyltransferase
MAANLSQIQIALHQPYDRILFAKDILNPVFGSTFLLSNNPVAPSIQPTKGELAIIDQVFIFGQINLEDNVEVTCYEITLQDSIRLEQSKVAIQRYVRKLLTVGQAAIICFISPKNKNLWRLTFVSKDSELTNIGVKEKITHAKRYTYLLGPSETCKTAAENFVNLSIEKELNLQSLEKAFSVEKLSRAFFDEYTIHYKRFVAALTESESLIKTFEGNQKAARDFAKKLLGRIVFIYFLQKKGWLGASDLSYKDGIPDFIMQLFLTSGANKTFYPEWLSKLFFDSLNKDRPGNDFLMPNGQTVKVPFLNGGLFDKDDYDNNEISFNPSLFHNKENPDDPKQRGFLDFLNAFNFTIYEDSPEDQTIAVDPEMLGHIFENLLEDNKDRGTFYTPKDIVHYMCQESLTEYLNIHLDKLERDSIELLVKQKDVANDTRLFMDDINQLLALFQWACCKKFMQ